MFEADDRLCADHLLLNSIATEQQWILRPLRASIEVDPARLDALTGTYRFESGPQVAISRQGDALVAQVEGQRAHQLVAESETRYSFRVLGGHSITFEPGAGALRYERDENRRARRAASRDGSATLVPRAATLMRDLPPTHGTRAGDRRAGPVLLMVASLALALLAAELVVRTFDVGPRFQVVFRESIEPRDDPELGYALRPHARDGRRQISSDGLRDREYQRAKPEGAFRIVAIGDSVTYGSGGPREAAWGEQLEELLQSFGRRPFEVLNLGVPGYHIGQSVQRLRGLGLDFAPDLVLYGYVLNDPQAFSVEAAALDAMRGRPQGGEPSVLRRALSHSRLFLLARLFVPVQGDARSLRDAIPPDPAYAASGGADRIAYFRSLHAEGESANRLATGLATLGRISRERGIPIWVLVFPLFDDDGASPASPPDVHRHVVELARQSGLGALDLLPVFENARASGRSIATDFLHPNALGARFAAMAALLTLCDERLLPTDSIDCAGRLR